ncbi:MAG: hypothetical protein ACYC3X_08950 [Pirellulaceae bacterium]
MQFCKLGLSLLLVLLLLAVCTRFSGAEVPEGPRAAEQAIGVKDLNVLVIVIDPVLKTKNNRKLHEHMQRSDPYKLTLKLVEDLRVASHGYVNYHVVDMIEYDGFTQFKNGFTYTEEKYLHMWEHDREAANPGMTSFKWLFDKFDLPKCIAEKNIAEIWLWGAPYMQWDELHWKIPGDKVPYQTDNPWFYRPYDIPDVGRSTWIMGFSYERGEGEALEDFCHRIESVMSLTVGKGVWDAKKNSDNVWNRFTRTDKTHPGESEVGSCHEAPNSADGYDWDNPREVWTYADDWLTYPVLPRKKKLLNAESGGWKGIVGHHMWFMQHLPHTAGVKDGFYNNWWQYIVNYDEAIQKLPPPGATFEKARTAMY